VLGWLTRLFRQRVEADAAPAVVPPPPEAPLLAIPPPTDSDAPIEAADQSDIADQAEADQSGIADPAVEEPLRLEISAAATDADAKETCPTCGKTGVFAGPPGQRFCTYCALRDELFERSAAATE
jgi:hypothetical protein